MIGGYKIDYELLEISLRSKLYPWEDYDTGRVKGVMFSGGCCGLPTFEGLAEGNYDVEQKLRENGVINKRTFTDSEYCSMYVYFTSKSAADNFIKRFIAYIKKREVLIDELYCG